MKIVSDTSNNGPTEVIITGYDAFGNRITETLLVPSNGDTVTSEKPFYPDTYKIGSEI